jgi:integrase
MRQLFDRYMVEVATKKALSSYKCNQLSIKSLYTAFGHMLPQQITPVHIYKFLDNRGKVAPVRANREKALLSHIFSMAIRWGLVGDNPCRNVKRLPEKRRDRYVTDEEFQAVFNIAPDGVIKDIMQFAYLTGLRQNDVLKVKLCDIYEEGVFVYVTKTKKKILMKWDNAEDEQKEFINLVARSRQFAESLNSEYLFPTSLGSRYTSSGFQSIWQRLIKKALGMNIIQERFRFNDIRRKTATDIEDKLSREDARKLLGHDTQKTTEIYISGVRKVKTLRRL